MFYEKTRLFFAKKKAIRILLFTALFITGVFVIGFVLQKYYPSMSDTTKGTVGTLLGAVVGGGFTLYGSMAINKKAQKASNAIKRKNLIYKPLYDELVLIHTEILKENPYPWVIDFSKGTQTYQRHPQYTVWGRIQKDTRIFEAPAKLVFAMNDLYDSINQFQEKRKSAVVALDKLYRKEYRNTFGEDITVHAYVGATLADNLLTGKRPETNVLLWDKKTDEITADRFWNRLQLSAKYNPSFRQIWKAKEKWERAESNAIDLLGIYIQYINARYEE